MRRASVGPGTSRTRSSSRASSRAATPALDEADAPEESPAQPPTLTPAALHPTVTFHVDLSPPEPPAALLVGGGGASAAGPSPAPLPGRRGWDQLSILLPRLFPFWQEANPRAIMHLADGVAVGRLVAALQDGGEEAVVLLCLQTLTHTAFSGAVPDAGHFTALARALVESPETALHALLEQVAPTPPAAREAVNPSTYGALADSVRAKAASAAVMLFQQNHVPFGGPVHLSAQPLVPAAVTVNRFAGPVAYYARGFPGAASDLPMLLHKAAAGAAHLPPDFPYWRHAAVPIHAVYTLLTTLHSFSTDAAASAALLATHSGLLSAHTATAATLAAVA